MSLVQCTMYKRTYVHIYVCTFNAYTIDTILFKAYVLVCRNIEQRLIKCE